MVIKIDPKKIKSNLESLCDAVFSPRYSEIAYAIIQKIKEDSLTSSNLRDFIKENGFAERSVYEVLKQMSELGMIYKHRGRWFISKDFGNALLKLWKAWKKLFD